MSTGRLGNRGWILGVALALVVTLVVFYHPLIQGSIRGHDSRTHTSWLLSIMEAFRSGVLYPRWLPDQFSGLGAPVFYYYPPFSSFFFGLVDLLTLHLLPVGSVIVVATFILSLASCATFYYWARGLVGGGVFALVAAVFYGVAPYHVQIDYLARGAMAEFAAFVWIPLIFAGIQRWFQRPQRGPLALVVIGCTGLFVTHLLSGMLVAMAAIPYVLLRLASSGDAQLPLATRLRTQLLPLVLAVLLSVGLAACYLVPALSLLPYLNQSALMFTGIEQTALRYLLQPDKPKSFAMIVGLASLYLLGAAALAWLGWRRRAALAAGGQRRALGDVFFWFAVVAFFFVFMLGGLNLLVRAPSPLQKIQFLWRALVVVEFALCTLLCLGGKLFVEHSAKGAAGRYIKGGAVALLLGFALVSSLAAKKLYADPHTEDPARSEHVRLRMSPPEYFPPGSEFPVPQDRIGQYPAVVSGAAEIVSFRAEKYPTRLLLTVRASGPATIALPAYGFPGWAITDAAHQPYTTSTATPYKLLAVEVGAGEHVLDIARTTLPQERLGNWVSLATLVLTALFLLAAPALFARQRQGWSGAAAGTGTGTGTGAGTTPLGGNSA